MPSFASAAARSVASWRRRSSCCSRCCAAAAVPRSSSCRRSAVVASCSCASWSWRCTCTGRRARLAVGLAHRGQRMRQGFVCVCVATGSVWEGSPREAGMVQVAGEPRDAPAAAPPSPPAAERRAAALPSPPASPRWPPARHRPRPGETCASNGVWGSIHGVGGGRLWSRASASHAGVRPASSGRRRAWQGSRRGCVHRPSTPAAACP